MSVFDKIHAMAISAIDTEAVERLKSADFNSISSKEHL
jgi:hypothetical protein